MTEKGKELINNLIAAPNCYGPLKEAAQKYLETGTKEAKDELITHLNEDVCYLDDVLKFFDSEKGAAVLGEETAKQYTALAKEKLAKGEKYCFCPACTAGVALLENQEEL